MNTYGEPWRHIQSDSLNAAEVVADIGPDKLRPIVGTFFRRNLRDTGLPGADALAKRAADCVSARAGPLKKCRKR